MTQEPAESRRNAIVSIHAEQARAVEMRSELELSALKLRSMEAQVAMLQSSPPSLHDKDRADIYRAELESEQAVFSQFRKEEQRQLDQSRCETEPLSRDYKNMQDRLQHVEEAECEEGERDEEESVAETDPSDSARESVDRQYRSSLFATAYLNEPLRAATVTGGATSSASRVDPLFGQNSWWEAPSGNVYAHSSSHIAPHRRRRSYATRSRKGRNNCRNARR